MNDLKRVVARSYSRKLNLSKYGGANYETADFFCSYSEEVPADMEREEIKRVSALLYDMARSDVEESVQEVINSLKPKDDLQRAVTFANQVAMGEKQVYED